MISRMRETGMELAIDEGGAGLLPIRVLVSLGRNEFPPLPVGAAPSPRLRAGRLAEAHKTPSNLTRTASG
jgi:hypothetical protein